MISITKENQVKKTEQILFFAALAACCLYAIMKGTRVSGDAIQYGTIIMHASIVVFIGYLIASYKKINLTIAGMGLMALMSIGLLMKQLHLQGTGTVLLISMSGQILLGISYILHWNKNRQADGANYLLVMGIALIAQLALGLLGIYVDEDYGAKGLYLGYIFLGGVGTIKLSRFTFNEEIDGSLYILILTSIPFVISSTLSILV